MKKNLFYLAFSLIFSMNLIAQTPNYISTNGLVGWWPFSGNANDLSGNGNNGTVNGSTLTANRFGNTNDAYSFNGIGNYISLPNIVPTQIGTISFWFQTNSSNAQILVYQANANGDDGFGSANANSIENHTGISDQANSNGAVYMFDNSAGVIYYDPITLTHNQWYHMAVAYNNTNAFCYLNGTLIHVMDISTETANNTPTVTYIGRPRLSTRFLSGKFDDLGVWDRTLTQQEITALYQSCNVSASINPQSSTTFCAGGFVTLQANTGTDYNYEWYNNGVLINGANQSSFVASASGNYTVKVIDGACNATSSSISVTVNNAPSNSVLVSGNTTICSGSTVTLTAQGIGTYNWSNGATTQSITISQSGNYSVTVSNNGCSANSSATAVTVNPIPTPTIAASGNTTFCSGGFVTLTASGGQTYNWNTGATSNNITVNQSGTYNIAATSIAGCVGYASQVITVNPSPTVVLNDIGAFTNYYASPVMLTGLPAGGVYNGLGVSGNTFNPQQAGLGAHYITYQYTNPSNCSSTASTFTIVYDTLGNVCTSYDTLYTTVTDTLIINTTLGLNPPNDQNTILIYPNPASDHITIDNGNYTTMIDYTIKIENNAGQQVFQSLVNQAQFYVDLSTWTGDGLYFVHLIDPQGNILTTRKIVLQ